MRTFGTEEDGFSIHLEERSRLLRVRAYGFWSSEIAAAFATSVMEACRPPRTVTQLVVDAWDLKPQREEGQAALTSVFQALPVLGIEHASIVTGNALTKLQLMRLANAGPTRAIIEFTANK